MPKYYQAERPLSVKTKLPEDTLLLIGLEAREGISELFRYEFELLAEVDADVPFDQLLGQKVTAKVQASAKEASAKEVRYFSGITSRISQGGHDENFTSYRLEVVPQFWLLTKRTQSRIFQYKTVPEILKTVLTGLDVTYEIQGTFQQREYCVQYRESDFNFACRLMEEEGIYYFFKHTEGGHTMVLANTPGSHPDVKPSKAIYESVKGGNRPEERVYLWEKSQELRSGKTELWDHCFELPHKHLQADKAIIEEVQVGTVTHKMKVGGNDKLELYDFPGGYANRFDGINRGGGEQPAEVQKIFEDNRRTTEIRMQAEAAQGIAVRGAATRPTFNPAHKFTLERHFNADGSYVLTRVEHHATLKGDYRSGEDLNFDYSNSFTCIPATLPFRPPRVTAIPHVQGTQSAVVVGPPGDEIFTDKYGRIKVQFHWDRQGKNDGDSSCWLRVATPLAGKNWGMIHIPRVGHEVLVDFMNGDVNDPIVIGSLYNADMMPPYSLPTDKTQSGIKTRSSLSGNTETFNEICFEDKKGSELLYIRAEKDQTIAVENDEAHWVGRDREKEVERDEETLIGRDRKETLTRHETLTIKEGNRTETLEMGNDSITLKMGNQKTEIKLGKKETEAMQSIELKVGQSSIKVDQMGVTIKGMMLKFESQIMTEVKGGVITKVEAGAMLMEKGAITMIN